MKSLSLNNPHAIVMVGIPGSGKSFFAEKFSHTFGMPHIDIEALFRFTTSDTMADELLLHILSEITKTQSSLIIEAEASSRARRTELAKFFKSKGYEVLYVWVQTDNETSKQRTIKTRGVGPEYFDTAIKKFSAPHSSERPLVISGKHTYASQAKIVLKRLSAPRVDISSHQKPPIRKGTITVR